MQELQPAAEGHLPHSLRNSRLASGGGLAQVLCGRGSMKLYRVNKLAKPGGVVVKKKDILAPTDSAAVQQAADSPDCPICDVLRDGEKVGSVL
jgi:hypothetical protein